MIAHLVLTLIGRTFDLLNLRPLALPRPLRNRFNKVILHLEHRYEEEAEYKEARRLELAWGVPVSSTYITNRKEGKDPIDAFDEALQHWDLI